jgi:hypothetical protein
VRFVRSKKIWFLVVLVVVAAMFQQPVLSALLRKGLEIAFSKQGLVLRAESVQVGIASPLLIQGLSIHANEGGVRSWPPSASKFAGAGLVPCSPTLES